MSRIINLPSGNTVTMRDPKTLKQKDRAKIYAVGREADGLAILDALISILVEEWSFDLILPAIKIEQLGELDITDYDVLSKEAEAAQTVLFPQLEQSPEAEADPKARTGN